MSATFSLLVLAGFGLPGCATIDLEGRYYAKAAIDVPRELDKLTLPAYIVEPPDILQIEAVTNTRRADDPLRVGDQLIIQIANGLPLEIDPEIPPVQQQAEMPLEAQFKLINGPFLVEADGQIDLGPEYGSIPVVGLTVDQARQAIERHLYDIVGLRMPKLAVSLPNIAGKQEITGEHLVRMDGTVSLGVYGSVPVAGMTLDVVKAVIEEHLAQFMNDPEVSVDVLAYNSKVIYVIMDGAGYGQEVIRLPATGNETVLDAIAQIQGLSEVSSKKIWVARPAPAGSNCAQILDVHWDAIVAEGITTTNYQLFPGDRIYIDSDHLIAFDNAIGKLTAPFERIFGFLLLGSGTVQNFRFWSQQGSRGGGF